MFPHINSVCKGLTLPRAHFTNNFPLKIQIWWKFSFNVIPLYTVTLPHNFAHGMNIQLSCHVQNFIAITLLQLGWERKEWIWITMERSLVKWAPGHGVLCSIQGPTVNSWYYQSHQPSHGDYIVEGWACFNIKISFGSIGITMIMIRQFWDHLW